MEIGPAPRSIGLRIAAGVAFVEGVVLTGYAVYVLIQVLRLGITGPDPVSNPTSVALEIVLFLVFGVGLLATSWGLWRASRLARAPLVLAQLIALVVGVPLVGAPGSVERVVGVVLVVLALSALVAVFMPSTTRALVDRDTP